MGRYNPDERGDALVVLGALEGIADDEAEQQDTEDS